MTRMTLAASAAALIALAAPAGAEPARFDTLDAAVEAMIAAVRSGAESDVLSVFGEEARDVVYTGDAAEDMSNRIAIGLLFREGWRLEPNDDGSVTLAIGREEWPFPIPLVREDGAWAFDIAAGAAEITAREIGFNELDVLDLLAAYVDVQAAYRLADHDGDGVMEFAQHVISSEGTRDGLFWGDADSPMGIRLAQASLDGYADSSGDQPPVPHSGYYFRILTGQGPSAPGGEMSYLAGDNMVAGHAVLAVPAVYGETGIHSFMVAENGILLEADLGEGTLDAAIAMMTFDPGEGWSPVGD